MVMDFGSLRSSLDAVPITPNLEVSDVSEIVEAPSLSSLSPESNSSSRIAFLVGTLFLAVLLTIKLIDGFVCLTVKSGFQLYE